ncbi:DnaJ family domain-containing protein [Acerihabitans arboris]|uniref:DUF1992 domain-containing protein n=1 Tax=Acerihabitans arboris TaxID=2691583 RepID=A0A845SRJ2_9GAMM|nr:DUF1992 domain-containing protein [Acerihabitans arboris]NDL65962.1 DUF1992 domain-containing protein [Acerihabitans arboris]
MWLVDELAEQHIQQALREGEFDNLPGYGKPLQLDDDSAVPEDLRAGYRLLKNAGYLPAELQDRQDALRLSDLLQGIDEQDARHEDISARLRLLEIKLRQAGMSTDFLHHGYREQLQRRFGNGHKNG